MRALTTFDNLLSLLTKIELNDILSANGGFMAKVETDWVNILDEVFSFYVKGYRNKQLTLSDDFYIVAEKVLAGGIDEYMAGYDHYTTSPSRDFSEYNFTTKARYVLQKIFNMHDGAIFFNLKLLNEKAVKNSLERQKKSVNDMDNNGYKLPKKRIKTENKQEIFDTLNFHEDRVINQELTNQDHDELFDEDYEDACDSPYGSALVKSRNDAYEKIVARRKRNVEAWQEKKKYGGRWTYIVGDEILSSKDFEEAGAQYDIVGADFSKAFSKQCKKMGIDTESMITAQAEQGM